MHGRRPEHTCIPLSLDEEELHASPCMLILHCLPPVLLHVMFRQGMRALMPTSRYCCMTGSSLNRLPCTPAKLLVFWTASTLTCIMRCAKRQVDNVSATCSACTQAHAQNLLSCKCW